MTEKLLLKLIEDLLAMPEASEESPVAALTVEAEPLEGEESEELEETEEKKKPPFLKG